MLWCVHFPQPEHGAGLKIYLCLQFFKGYSRLLNNYMRKDTGIGLDLTQVRCFPSSWTPQNSGVTYARLRICVGAASSVTLDLII